MERKTASRIMVALGLIVGIVLSVAATAYAILQFGFLNMIDYDKDVNVTRVIETNLDALDVDAAIKGGFAIPVLQERGIKNYLLIGSDRRSQDEHGRSDAMMILTINNNTKKMHITSLMRAIYVSIPNEPDPGMEAYVSPQYMLNAAHTWGGPRLLMRTIERNFRVPLDGYFEIDFEGFAAAVNAIGGVRIDLNQAEANALNRQLGTGFSAGTNVLNGEAALEYSRLRNIDSDFARTGRQRNVIESLLRQAASAGPTKMIDLAKAILPMMKTDVSGGEITGELMGLPAYAGYEIDQLMLPIEGSSEMIYVNNMEMYRIDFAKNVAALHEFMQK